jgi:hypothetical protein
MSGGLWQRVYLGQRIVAVVSCLHENGTGIPVLAWIPVLF